MIRLTSASLKSCKSFITHNQSIQKYTKTIKLAHFRFSSQKDDKQDKLKNQNQQNQQKGQDQTIIDKIGNLSGVKKLSFFAFFAILGGTLSYAIFGEDRCKYQAKQQPTTQRQKSKGKSSFGGSWELIDQDNKPFRSEDIGNSYYLMYFGYTKCPDICPTTLQYLTKVLANMKTNKPQQANLKIVFVSVDPNRDNPEAMKNYLKLFNEPIIGLSGISEKDERLKDIMRKYKVYSNKISNPNGSQNSYNIDHTSLAFLVNPKHQYVDVVNTNLSEKQAAILLLKKINEDKGQA